MPGLLKALFVCRDCYYLDFPLVAEVLSGEFGWEVHALCPSSITTRIVKRNNPHVFGEIINMDEYFAENDDFRTVSLEDKLSYLSSIEDRLGIPSLFYLAYTDRIITQNSYEDFVTLIYGQTMLAERIHGMGFDIYVAEVGTFLEYVLWRFARGGRPYNFYPLPFNARFPWLACINGISDVIGFEENRDRINREGISSADREFLEEYRGRILNARPTPSFYERAGYPRRVLNFILARLERSRYRNRSRYVLEDIDSGGLLPMVLKWVKAVLNRNVMYPLFAGFSPLPKGKYIYFSLQSEPEISLLLSGPFYTDQAALVANVAKSIPVGYRLVMKDHPVMYGKRNVPFYWRLRKIPNVVLLHTKEDNLKVLEGASAVVTIRGSSALEGMLLGKHVFVLGDHYLKYSKRIHMVDTIRDLADEIRKHMDEPFDDDSDLVRFAAAYRDSAMPGLMESPLFDRILLAPENIRDIARFLHVTYKKYIDGAAADGDSN
jgi:hypothetical protein